MNYNSLDHVDVNLERLDQDPFPRTPLFFPTMEEGWHPYRAEVPMEAQQLRGSKDAKKTEQDLHSSHPFYF